MLRVLSQQPALLPEARQMGDVSPVFEHAGCKRSRETDGPALSPGNRHELALKMAKKKRKVIAWNPYSGMLPSAPETAARVVLGEAARKQPADFSRQHAVKTGAPSTSTQPLDASLSSPVHRQQPTEVAGGSQQPGADGEEDESEGWHEGDVDANGALAGFNRCYVPGYGTYEGIFHNGRPHGTGKLEKEDGTILDGIFDCGAFVSGTMSKGDIVYSGQFLDEQLRSNVRKTPIGQYTHKVEGRREHVLEGTQQEQAAVQCKQSAIEKTPVAAKATKRQGPEGAAVLQRKQSAIEKTPVAAQVTKQQGAEGAAALQCKRSAIEIAAAAAEVARSRSEEEAAALQRKQTAIEKTSVAAKATKQHGVEGAAAPQRKRSAIEKAAAAVEVAKRRSEEQAAALQRKQTTVEQQAAVHNATTSFMYHVGESRSTPCRIRRGPTTTSDHVGTMYGATVPVTKVEGVWAKLHVDAMDLARGSYGFSPFDIRTEGWIMLTTPKGVAIWEPARGPMRGSLKVRLID